MSKRIEPKEVVTEDSWSKKYSITKAIPSVPNAVRIEQGEYGITDINSTIGVVGTYNVEQCRVVYTLNPRTNLHGIAHIDGHTEISSLGKFFEELGGDKSDVRITLLGSTSNNTSGLNDSAKNIEKVAEFLDHAGFKTSQIEIASGAQPKDFVIDAHGVISAGIAEHGLEDRPLSVLPEMKRQGGWLGTYPLSRMPDERDLTVFLDERAIEQLKAYEQNPTKDQEDGARDPRDNTDYRLYDISIPRVITAWNASIDQILDNHTNSKIDREQLKEVLKSTTMHIGEGSDTKNRNLVDIINRSTTIKEAQDNLLSATQNTSTIADALSIAKLHDITLDESQVLNTLTTTYNEVHSTQLTPEQISRKSYGAEISVEDFTNTLSENSPTLKALMVLNSQGGYSLSTKQQYTVEHALEAATVLDRADILQQVRETHNSAISAKPTVDDLAQALDVAFNTATPPITLSRIDRLRLEHALKHTDSVVQDPESQKAQIVALMPASIANKESLANAVSARLTKTVNDKVEASKISESSKYTAIQSEFLSGAHIPAFSALTISEELAKRREAPVADIVIEKQYNDRSTKAPRNETPHYMEHTESSRAKIRQKVDASEADVCKVVNKMRARFIEVIANQHYMQPTISSLAKQKNVRTR